MAILAFSERNFLILNNWHTYMCKNKQWINDKINTQINILPYLLTYKIEVFRDFNDIL